MSSSLRTSMGGGNMSADELNELVERAQHLETERDDLDMQLDMVVKAKKSLEENLRQERKQTKQLQDKMASMMSEEEVEAKVQESQTGLQELLDQERAKVEEMTAQVEDAR